MENELVNDFYAVMNRIRLLGKRINSTGELSPAEFCMLLALSECQNRVEREKNFALGVTVSEMAEELGATLSAGSKLLRSVEEKGLIERVINPSDRRITYLKLSEKGKEVFEGKKRAQDKMMRKLICTMGEDNMKILNTQLQNLYIIMKTEMEAQEKND